MATDPGEWLWLERKASTAGPESEVTPADARRALTFALSWTLRLEAFVARYPAPPQHGWQEASLDDNYELPRLAAVAIQDERGPGRDLVVRLKLADVPPGWWRFVHAGFKAMQLGTLVPAGCWATASTDGTIELHLPDETDSESVRPLVDELLRRTHEEFERRLDERREVRNDENELASEYAGALVVDRRGCITSVQGESRAGASKLVRAQTALPEALPPDLLEEALRDARHDQSGGYIRVLRGELSSPRRPGRQRTSCPRSQLL